MGYEWSGISLQEIESGGKTVFLFVLGAVFAYLFLAAQYESWSIPVAIILAVPLGLLGAVALPGCGILTITSIRKWVLCC
jgi:HAE1 family hydrophobic/amphiphilic exporter-1